MHSRPAAQTGLPVTSVINSYSVAGKLEHQAELAVKSLSARVQWFDSSGE